MRKSVDTHTKLQKSHDESEQTGEHAKYRDENDGERSWEMVSCHADEDANYCCWHDRYFLHRAEYDVHETEIGRAHV